MIVAPYRACGRFGQCFRNPGMVLGRDQAQRAPPRWRGARQAFGIVVFARQREQDFRAQQCGSASRRHQQVRARRPSPRPLDRDAL
jgi:hypothetical protein